MNGAALSTTRWAPLELAERIERLPVRTPTMALPVPETGSTVWMKLEYCQPSGSVKDRFAVQVIADALRSGAVTPGTTVAEASSGSTSLALAMVCAHAGVPFRAFLPDGIGVERRQALLRYGADLVLTPAADGVAGAMAACQELAGRPGIFLPRQFSNPLNLYVHRTRTGPELREQVPVPLDAVVCGVGTGGTLAGIAADLLAHRPTVIVARAMPSPPLPDRHDGCPLSVPGVVDGLSELLRELPAPPVTIAVDPDSVLRTTRELCRNGYPVGLSSGLNLAAARLLARQLPRGAQIATVLCDRMDRYVSSVLFDDLR